MYGFKFVTDIYSVKVNKLFRSYRIPYIPKNVQLKDKDNKLTRHLKFRFVYVCPADDFNLIAKSSKQINNVKELFFFKKNKILFVGFFVVENEEIEIPYSIVEKIKEYPYKLYDTYVMGDTRIFGDIEDILINQGYDRDAYGDKSISTTYLNEICSNKMEYINYFLRHGLMLGTWIKPYRNGNNTYPNMYVKAPYSSRSACASLNKIDSELCYLMDGVIVQEENKMLSKYEVKCYVIDGKVTMTIVRLDGKNFNVCIPDDFSGVSPEIKKLIEQYKDEISLTCLKAYYFMNALIDMRVAQKLKNDETEAGKIIENLRQTIEFDERLESLTDHEYLRIRYILTGLVNATKETLISELNATYNKSYDVRAFTRRIVDYTDPLDRMRDSIAYSYDNSQDKSKDLAEILEALKNIKIYDRFMRVDMALPDIQQSGIYDRITVTEIEPLASGIYMYKTIGACMKDDDMNTFDNIVKYNLYSIISTEHNKKIDIDS